jgi:hypothetical protein
MPLPDKHADEPAVEADRAIWDRYLDAKSNAIQWEKIAAGYRAQLELEAGDAFALTIDGVKVATYRPTATYAVKRLQADYPDLTAHYRTVVTKQELDMNLFAKAHPEIAEKYRVRSFREVEQ